MRKLFAMAVIVFFSRVVCAGQAVGASSQAGTPLEIGSQLQLFVDRYVIGSMTNLELRLQQPVKQPLARSPFAGYYATVIKDGDLYRAYWRSEFMARPDDKRPTEIYRYAESRDGHEWDYPSLGLHEVEGSTSNNVIFKSVHNFSPFLDTKPGVPASERFKGLAGRAGLQAFLSEDGIHWKDTYVMVRNRRGGPPYTGCVIEWDPVWTNAFDSQNVSFWSEAEQQYVCYFRTYGSPNGEKKPVRTISRVTSTNFLGEWSKPVTMEANDPGENLYTSQTQPYFRAPHIYLAFPTRLITARGSSTDILFMSTRPGSTRYERLFKEAFIRPGPDPERWGNRANYAALNVVPTGPDEMSIYHSNSGYRYVLRTDGFVSVHAGAGEGELLTKYFKFTGGELLINYSTSASGSIRVEIQDGNGKPIPGFRLMDCAPVVGDKIEQDVKWGKDSVLKALEGRPVRLRFVMMDCDLYSFRFGDGKI